MDILNRSSFHFDPIALCATKAVSPRLDTESELGPEWDFLRMNKVSWLCKKEPKSSYMHVDAAA